MNHYLKLLFLFIAIPNLTSCYNQLITTSSGVKVSDTLLYLKEDIVLKNAGGFLELPKGVVIFKKGVYKPTDHISDILTGADDAYYLGEYDAQFTKHGDTTKVKYPAVIRINVKDQSLPGKGLLWTSGGFKSIKPEVIPRSLLRLEE